MGQLTGHGLSTVQRLASTADVAEVTFCFLMHRETRVGHNAFTLIRFLSDPLHRKLRGSTNLTNRPELVAGHQKFLFGAKRSYMDASDVILAMAGMNDSFCLNIDGKAVAISSPGDWHHPIAIARDEHHTSGFVPGRGFRWQLEHWASTSAAVVQFAAATRHDIWTRIYRTLASPVPYERLGNLIVTIEGQTKLHLITSDDARTLGVRILGPRPDRVTAIVELSHADEGYSATTHSLEDEFSVLRVTGPAQRCTVSLFGADGTLMTRSSCELRPRREIKVHGQSFVFDSELRHARVLLPNAESPIEAYVQWQPHDLRPDPVHEWEREVLHAPVRRAQATLVAHKKFILYEGGEDERHRAVADIRGFLGQYGTESVRVWDPYCDAKDLITFLTAISNSNAEIRVLTHYGKKEYHDDLLAVKHWLKNPGPGIPPAPNVSVRFFTGPSHDRFLLCGDRCWQLGCSLNQIGANIGTIVELPVSDPVQLAFEAAWKQSKPW